MRKLTRQETSLVKKLLDNKVAGGEQLRRQLVGCTVFSVNRDETILQFNVSTQICSAIVPYTQNVAVEGLAVDIDGGEVEVLLHVKNGRMFELEYIKIDGTLLQRRPYGEDLVKITVNY